jgi:hypothetical protein
MRAGLKTQKTGTRNASRVNTKGKAFRVDQRTIDLDPLTRFTNGRETQLDPLGTWIAGPGQCADASPDSKMPTKRPRALP